MRYWLITDPHFGHNKIKKFCNRPDNHEQRIFKGLNKHAGIYDILICLGDFLWNSGKYWHDKLRNACQPTSKWLIKGNHDKASNTFYHAQGWDIVCESLEMCIYGDKIILSHKPVWCDMQHKNIHGHFHNIKSKSWEKDLVSLLTYSHRLLSIEEMNYQPVTLQWAAAHLPCTVDKIKK